MLTRLITALTLLLACVSTSFAQAKQEADSQPPALTVTIFASNERVRFTAPSSIVQMRLEIYDVAGRKLFDNELRGGNVLDWLLQDGQAARLADDTYLCVVTIKSRSGRITQRLGSVIVAQGSASAVAATQLTAQQTAAIGPVEENAALTVIKADEMQATTVIAHNGEEGQIVRGRGALSFRLGDFFSGKDSEQMRLTHDGKLGIGVTDPQAKLDVAGSIRTSEGIVFPDGSVQTTAYVAPGRSLSDLSERGKLQRDAQGRSLAAPGGSEVALRSPTLNITGNGTAGMLAKWTGTNGNASSDVGNSVVTELNGNIGVGTGNPSASFHASRSDGSYQYKMERTGSNARTYGFGADSFGNFFLDDLTGAARRVTLDTSGNVGFGTTGPSASVHATRGDGSYQFKMERTGTNARTYGFGADSFGNFFLDDVTSLARRLTIDITGNAGIGTTTPADKLMVQTPTNNYGLTHTDGTVTVGTYVGSGGNNQNAGWLGTKSNHPLFFFTNNSGALMTLAISGNVGIGTTSPSQKLHVTRSGDYQLRLENPAGGGGFWNIGQADNSFHSGGGKLVFVPNSIESTNAAVVFTNDGHVGIGITDPGDNSLYVSGKIFSFTLETSIFKLNTLSAGGDEAVCLNTSTREISHCSSSLRYKKEIAPFRGGLEILNRLRPIRFTWKASGSRDLGLGAEDVAAVEPLLVTHNDKGEIEGVRYAQLSAIFINAFKQQQAQLSKQQREIERLKNQMRRLQIGAHKHRRSGRS